MTGVGPGGIAGLGTSALTITTNGNAIVNWQGFSIGINEITKILQPSAVNAILNRVALSGGQSFINGALQSNGRVFLINPNGIVFGASSRIDVAGLVASSLSMSDSDFLAGKLRFTETTGAGAVINNGTITAAAGGNVYLVAPDVQNAGVINAPNGDIVLAAGKSAELVSDSSPYVSVKVTADTEQALNVGSLIASSGRVGMFGALVRNSGVAEASAAVAGPGGQISFVATKDLTLDAGSRTAANGTSGGDILLQAQGGTNLISGTVEAKGSAGNGGTVQALGVRVGVIGSGVIDASGDTGGGTVLVGGDAHGANPGVQNSQYTYIGQDGVIRADASTVGNGGRVIVWSDGPTQFYGAISARGGSQSGDGGFVETSGTTLSALGSVLVGAPNGQGGTWLLDPLDLEIVAGTTSPTQFCSTAVICASDSYGSQLGVGFIDGFLAASPGATVQADAQRDINFSADLALSNPGNVVAIAGRDINLNGHNIAIHGSLTAQAGGGAFGIDFVPTYGGGAYGLGSITGGGNISTDGNFVNAIAQGNIGVGNVDTRMTSGGTSSNETRVDLSAGSGAITTGSIMTGDSVAYTDVNLFTSSGAITTGSITTGNSTGGGETFVLLSATGGPATVNGSVSTGSGGDSFVDIYAGRSIPPATDNVTVTGSITTGSAVADSSIELEGGSVNVGGSIATGSAMNTSCCEALTSIYIEGALGAITVGGSIASGNANNPGGSASSTVSMTAAGPIGVGGGITTGSASAANTNTFVDISTSAGAISIGGGITTGNAISDGGETAASDVRLFASAGSISVAGPIATGTATNPDGADSSVSLVAYGGGVTVSGGIATGDAIGGTFGGVSSTVFVDSDGSVDIQGPITTGNATTTNAFSFSDSEVSLLAGGGVHVGGAIRTGNADGGEGALSAVAAVATGGSVSIGGSITTGSAHFNPAATCCAPRGVSAVALLATGGSISVGAITTGASSDANSTFYGGPVAPSPFKIAALADGGVSTGALTTRSFDPVNPGGDIFITSTSGAVVVAGAIDTRGADGAAGSPNGTAGGSVMLSSPTSIMVGAPVIPGIDTTVINTSGGAGAAGGMGGNAGSVTVDPTSITMNGVILALGGAGNGAAGGNGGALQLLTTGGTGTITFINGGWDLSGGVGSPPGVDGVVTADGTLIFITVLNDALSNPAVAQAVGSSIAATLAATNSDSGGDDNGKDKKKGFGSCKPS